MTPLRVCIVGLKCYDHIAGNPVPRYLGGIETQLAVLARALSREGCHVTLITYDHGQASDITHGGVRVIRSFAPQRGFPVVKWLHPQTTRLWKAMRLADAEVYLQMGAGFETAQVAWGCRRLFATPRPFVFCLASDANYSTHLHAGLFGLEGRAYHAGLSRADLIIAQTENQQEGLQRALGLRSEVIPMAVEPLDAPGQAPPDPPSTPHILWVGRITPTKRLEWLVDLAMQCPDFHFDVVGTPNKGSGYAEGILASARRMPNVTVHGRVARPALVELYRQASLLCCTSSLEGFPTTFLEAWSFGLPVVTTFDPDQIVQRHHLGEVVGDPVELQRTLRDLLTEPDRREAWTRQIRAYFKAIHSPAAVARQFAARLQDLRKTHP